MFRKFLDEQIKNNSPVFLDGGMGTMIQKLCAIKYQLPEDLNFYGQDVIRTIHTEYLRAGCNIISANTFGANPIKLSSENASHTSQEYITRGIEIARKCISDFEKTDSPFANSRHFIAWDSGQIGKLLEPMGTLTFDEAYESYRTAAVAAEKAGAQVALIETMSDLYEVKAAVLAIKENTDLAILTSMTFQNTLRTLTGADVLTCVTYLESLGVDALGFNCGGDLQEDRKLAEEFLRYIHIPFLIQPNAGLPAVENGKTIFKVGPEEFSQAQYSFRKLGANILGGCCGTTPEHLALMIKNIIENDPFSGEYKNSFISNSSDTYVCSYNRSQKVGGSFGPVIIGERINPTGKKKCKEALTNRDMNFIINEAESQINSGAHILDVNAGLPGIDEAEIMLACVKSIQKAFNVPLQLDSSEYPVLEKSLRYYNGKALVNSVNGKQESMDKVFPLIRHYGGSVVALCIDENGIAPTAQGRVEVADKIICEAAKYGISPRDIFIDTLTLTVSSEQRTALETVRAIQILTEKYGSQGLRFVLGVSNISFGLPRRDIMNSRFFMLCLNAGLTAAIINPGSSPMMDTYRAYRSLACFDENSLDYITTYSGTTDPTTAKFRETILVNAINDGTISISLNSGTGSKSFAAGTAPVQKPSAEAEKKNEINDGSKKKSAAPEEEKLINIIEKGFKDQAADATEELLKTKEPVEVINNCIVPALDSVGKDFEKGKKFLPQLLLSADTVSSSFGKIKETLEKNGEKSESKGDIVIATVHGDIHDIGKNIVRAMLENYGYNVIDLGKNVAADKIVTTVLENNIELVGLSALMTTTVTSMENTIAELRQALSKANRKCTIMVGGAVLTPDYAQKIGADYYCKDAMESVSVAKEVFGK